MFEPWFMWAFAGFVCIGLEMILPGFVVFLFGIGGLVTALCCLIPFISTLIWLQILIFIASSIASLVFLRQKFTRIFTGTVFDSKRRNAEDDGIGKIADVLETVSTKTEGRIRFQGMSWKAHSCEGECVAGSKVRIVAREGMSYIVKTVSHDIPD